MVRQQFPFERNGPSRVEITYEPNFDDARIFVDGALVHRFFGPKLFERGVTIPLQDGAELQVRLRRWIGMEVRRNGIPLPGSATDPAHSLYVAAGWMYWIGGVGLAVELERFVRAPPNTPHTVVALQMVGDAVFLGLALLTRRGARWALGLAVVMMFVSLIVSWQMGRGVIATIWTLFILALLAQRFAASAKTAFPRAPEEREERRKAMPLGWPSPDDDERD